MERIILSQPSSIWLTVGKCNAIRYFSSEGNCESVADSTFFDKSFNKEAAPITLAPLSLEMHRDLPRPTM